MEVFRYVEEMDVFGILLLLFFMDDESLVVWHIPADGRRQIRRV